MNVLCTPEQAIHWLRERVGQGRLNVDSRQIGDGDGFIAWPGAAVDGREFVQGLLSRQDVQVAACLVEEQDAQNWAWVNEERVAVYSGLKTAISAIAAGYFEQPSQQLEVLAITGTNGKTSCSWWLAQALTALEHGCGVMGTLGVGMLDRLEASSLTTPDPVRLHGALRALVNQGAKACAIEASSIGLVEHRFDDVHVKVALLTNVTQDHLDYHQTMQAYWHAKQSLFAWQGLESAVVNVDDSHGEQLAAELAEKGCLKHLYTYSRQGNSQATLQAVNLHHTAQGLSFDLLSGTQHVSIDTVLVGDYNVSNLLGVAGVLQAMGYTLADVARAFSMLTPVPGRMQSVFALQENVPKVVVDYAHTPDALLNALQALKPLAQARLGKLWCVMGCGGNRDAAKRPLMGQISQQEADCVVVTSDNPRTEELAKIIEQIVKGMQASQALHVEVDRRKAIAWVLSQAQVQDVVLIAGKGHETYQEIKGVRYPFSDAEVASQQLNMQAQIKGFAGLDSTGMMTLQQAKDLLQSQGITARLLGAGDTLFARVHTDTRTLQPGDLFVALKGDNFDAHDFLLQAHEKGAVAALAQYGLKEAGIAGLEVPDARKALGALASGWRACWDLPLIAVTGSNGKTTTTQMIASILHAWQGKAALATQGNLNNDIGVPLMLLRLRAQHKVAVIELGMNHPGEIAYLAQMTRPDVALVNNAQREHQEFMTSVDAVAHENGQVLHTLPQNGVAIFPAGDVYTSLWRSMAQGRHVETFAMQEDAQEQGAANYTATAQWDKDAWVLNLHTPEGDVNCRLHCAGVHNVKNALAAAACAQQVGAPLPAIIAGLNAFVPVSGRSQVELLQFGDHAITLINDAYNANPDSVRAAIDVLAGLPQPAMLVLGEMGEVGSQGKAFHHEVGLYAREKGVTALWAAGDLVQEAVRAFGEDGLFFDNVPQLADALVKEMQAVHYGSILVKGSRFMKMERVIERLHEVDGGSHVA